MRRLPVVRIFAFVFLCGLQLAGQTVEPEMTADRPGFRNSTHLVGSGVVQVENGLSLTSDHTVSWGPEIRIGTFRWLELRLVADNIVIRRSPGASESGVSDLQPGIKFPVFDRIPGTRVVAIVKSTVPSGHSSQTSGAYEPGAELIWEHKLSDDLSLAGTWNLSRLKAEQVWWQRGASLSANRSLGHHGRTFAEVFVVSPQQPGEGNQWALDAGLMRILGEHVMVDVAAGHSLHGARAWFATVGISVRTRVPPLIVPGRH